MTSIHNYNHVYICTAIAKCAYQSLYIYINDDKSTNIAVYMNMPAYIFLLCV